jgi:hypothetical protein
MTSSCASSSPKIQTIEAACQTLKPIEYHWCEDGADDAANRCDTWPTIKRIYEHNSALGALCRQ